MDFPFLECKIQEGPGSAGHQGCQTDQQDQRPEDSHAQYCRHFPSPEDAVLQALKQRAAEGECQQEENGVGPQPEECLVICQSGNANAKHPAQSRKGGHQVRGSEEYPANVGNEEDQDDPPPARKFLEIWLEPEPFGNDQQSIIQSPYHVGKVRSMPDAGKQPDYEQIADEGFCAFTAAAQRNVDIVPEPAGKSDVPPPPEITDRHRPVRMVKVLRNVKAEPSAHANGHIGISREIEVQLEGVGQGQDPGTGPGGVGLQGRKHFSESIGQNDFLGQSPGEFQASGADVLEGDGPGGQFRFHFVVLDNGALCHFREKGQVQRQFEKVCLCSAPSGVYIGEIGQGRECVEGDPQREGQPQGPEPEPRQDGIQILVESQDDQKSAGSGPEQRFAVCIGLVFEGPSGKPDPAGLDEKQHQSLEADPGIEEPGQNHEKDVAAFICLQRPVSQNTQGQEGSKKQQIRETHSASSNRAAASFAWGPVI